MADGSEKRRLEMMPEVLPAPPPRDAAPSAPRARALEHMQKLLAGATATAALVGCGSEDPTARPEPSATGATTTAPTASSPATASPSATASAEPTATASAEALASSSATPEASASNKPGGSGFAGGTATIPQKKQPPPPPPPTGYMVVDPMPPPARRP